MVDMVDVGNIVEQRAAVMKTVPTFLKGPFRNVLKVALEEILASPDVLRQERGWKLLMLLPRFLLHRPLGGGLIAKDKLEARFHAFGRGEWVNCWKPVGIVTRRQRNPEDGDDVERVPTTSKSAC